MREIEISQREAGQRLDRFLSRYMPGASSGFLHKMLRKKNIKRNQIRAQGGDLLEAGDRIQLYFSEETLEKFCRPQREPEENPSTWRESGSRRIQSQSPARKCVKLLYRDEDILAFHKPAGMLSQKADSRDDSLNDYLIDYCLDQGILTREDLYTFRPSVANRLDRNTSGIVLCGISVRGLQTLSRLLKNRELGKYYLCPVKGEMHGEGRLAGYMSKDRKSNRTAWSREKKAGAAFVETAYRVLDSSPGVSLLEIHLITGKSHQIRSHLASIGHPVLGDYKYGDRPFNDRLKKKYGLSHQLLHCWRVYMPDGHLICDPMPADLERICRDFGLAVPEEAGYSKKRRER